MFTVPEFCMYRRETPLGRLGTAELLVVCVLRLWVAPLRTPDRPRHDWRQGLIAAGVEKDGAPAFDALLGIVETAALRPLDIRELRNPRLAGDEAALLSVDAALQLGREDEAAIILAGLLPPAAARMALAPARRLAGELARAGLGLAGGARFGTDEADVSASYPDRGLSLVQ